MTLGPGHVAGALYDQLGPDAYAVVSTWLNDVAADFGLETHPDGRVISPSVVWPAEAVALYNPERTS
jgi:hypothetical protein